MNNKITTDIISTTGIKITKYDILPAKVFINGVEVTDTESWNKAISTFSELQDKINNLQSKIDKAIEYIEKNTHNIYADGYRDRMTGELLSKEKTPIINRVFSQNPKDLLDILKEVE